MNEEELFLRRMQDLADQADRIGYVVFSDFLDGGQRARLMRFRLPSGIVVTCNGGYEAAERSIAAFYPSFLSYEDIAEASPLSAVKIQLKGARFLKKIPQHRDYLGALMRLGIRRETLGDILVNDEGAAVVTTNSIKAFLKENLMQVGAAEVEISDMEVSELNLRTSDGKELIISVSSPRLDAVISKGFQIGRQEAAQLVRSGRAQVNWVEVTSIDHNIKENDLISVRGHGRLRVHETRGLSRSGRQQIRVERFGA